MSSGARHGIGVLIGLVVTPVIALCLFYAVNRASITFRQFVLEGNWSDRLIVLALLLVAAVLLGLVMGSRLSPVSSLIPGLFFTVSGLMWLLAPRFALDHTSDVLPTSLDRGYSTVGPFGILLLLGVTLLTASVSPSRWRVAGASPAPSRYGAQPGPMGPGGAAPPPYGSPGGQYQPAVPPGQYQPAQAPYAPGSAVPPHYSPPGGPAASGPPGAAQPPPAPEPPRETPGQGGGQERQEAGEWTQMYGGDDLRGGRGGSSGS